MIHQIKAFVEAEFEPGMNGEKLLSRINLAFGKEVLDGYGSLVADFYGEEAVFYNDYGDSDLASHYYVDIEALKPEFDAETFDYDNFQYPIGICVWLRDNFYCFDVGRPEIFVSVEQTEHDPKAYVGKRAFYHYRGKGLLSMRGYFNVGTFHTESETWVSGPRTLFNLVKLE